jgi:hypothetical protein
MRLLSLLEDERKSGTIWYVLFRQSPKSLWWECALAVRTEYSGLGAHILRALHPPRSRTWRRHAAVLKDLGLVDANEQEHAECP